MKPIKDGVVNTGIFNSEGNTKILWILKEGNVSPEDYDKQRDICEELREGAHMQNALSIPTFKRIIYTSYWILHPEKEWSSIPFANEEECYSAVNHIAYININKNPAAAVSNDGFLYDSFSENKEVLLAQIQEINPEVIIFGNTLKFFGDTLSGIGWNIDNKITLDENTDMYVTENKGLIINSFHPAYFKVSDKNYSEGIKNAYLKYKQGL